jgi:hypothetical protein
MTIITERQPKNKWVAKAEVSEGVPEEYLSSGNNTEAQAVVQVMRIAAMKALNKQIDPEKFYQELGYGIFIKRL